MSRQWPTCTRAAVMALAGAARVQAGHWRDTLTLYERALAVTDGNHLAERALGDELLARGRLDEARRHFARAVELRPGWVEAELGLADVWVKQGQLARALPLYEKWIERQPDYARPVGSLGLAPTMMFVAPASSSPCIRSLMACSGPQLKYRSTRRSLPGAAQSDSSKPPPAQTLW